MSPPRSNFAEDAVDGADDALRRLYGAMERASRMVGFTGAGVSTESGVPDFRSPGSPWLENPPVDYHSFMASAAARREAWARKFRMDDVYRDAKPGVVHHLFARLVADGKMLAIITQNIDALHQAAGTPSDKVIELHGNGKSARCVLCGRRHEIATVRHAFEATGEPPVCACGGFVKSATVSFGEPMPQAAMRAALDAVRACDVVVCVGSSLLVRPAADFITLAKAAGAFVAIVNRAPTPFDAIADCHVAGDAERVFAPFLQDNAAL